MEACIQRDICKATNVPASMVPPQFQTLCLPEVLAEGLKLSNDCVRYRAIEAPDRDYQSGDANKCVPRGVSQKIPPRRQKTVKP